MFRIEIQLYVIKPIYCILNKKLEYVTELFTNNNFFVVDAIIIFFLSCQLQPGLRLAQDRCFNNKLNQVDRTINNVENVISNKKGC